VGARRGGAVEAALKVFCSFRSADRAAVEAFARRLRERGLNAWFDEWEIKPGDDLVARLDSGVDGCHGEDRVAKRGSGEGAPANDVAAANSALENELWAAIVTLAKAAVPAKVARLNEALRINFAWLNDTFPASPLHRTR
jgi:hypothetical protein